MINITPLDWNTVDTLIKKSIYEDIGDGDITTNALEDFFSNISTAVIISKDEGIIAGIEIAHRVYHLIDKKLKFSSPLSDGDQIQHGITVAEVSGPTKALLQGERTALNFLCRLSGIATMTSRFVNKVKDTKTQILDTRKTTPGWRLLEKYAVAVGGGSNHRMGLFDMFLIKDNHIKAAGGIDPAIKRVLHYRKKMGLNFPVEVEVQTLDDVRIALENGVDRIMLDNMPVLIIREAVSIVDGKIPLEVSGNVTPDSLNEIARTGVDFISSGYLTHSAPALDFTMKMK